VVATPIGNLRDVTLRALDLLASVDRIAAEDTRHTRFLLDAHGIGGRLVALHEHNEVEASGRVVGWLREGLSVALVTDAGTPGISDPGALVVREVRAAGLAVTPVPGPSALIAALSVAGVDSAGFRFSGFLPARREARRRWLESVADSRQVVACYEAPHRVRECLEDMGGVFGPDRRVTLCRELTKVFENVHEVRVGDAAEWLDADPNRLRGEFVILIHAAPADSPGDQLAEGERVLGILLREMPASQAARLAAKITGARRADLYEAALRRGGGSDDPED